MGRLTGRASNLDGGLGLSTFFQRNGHRFDSWSTGARPIPFGKAGEKRPGKNCCGRHTFTLGTLWDPKTAKVQGAGPPKDGTGGKLFPFPN